MAPSLEKPFGGVTPMLNVLHLGCGRKQWNSQKLMDYCGLKLGASSFTRHLDRDPSVEPDLLCNLGTQNIPLVDECVDVAIAWHVIEHIGGPGDATEPQKAWFHFWEELYRVLKPNGWIYGESPNYDGIWAWSDPTHVRAMSEASFVFFNQDSYRIPESAISPYRIRCDFEWLALPGLPDGRTVIVDPKDSRNRMLRFALKAKKPFHCWWHDAA